VPSSKKNKGWYVELPADLVEAFDKAFPKRGAKTALTLAAVKQAIERLPELERERERLHCEGRRLEGDNAKPPSGEATCEEH
jgi:hypothetical protein